MEMARTTSAALYFRALREAMPTRRACDARGPFCGPEAPRTQRSAAVQRLSLTLESHPGVQAAHLGLSAVLLALVMRWFCATFRPRARA
jgi:hypothetical protein